MNDFAFHYKIMAEEAENKADLSLSNAEHKLSQVPCKPIGYRTPSEIAKELLAP